MKLEDDVEQFAGMNRLDDREREAILAYVGDLRLNFRVVKLDPCFDRYGVYFTGDYRITEELT